MAIEIRELIIKTTIVSDSKVDQIKIHENMNRLRRELMEECKSILTQNNKKIINKR